jgi:translation initiation factor 3 subunit B
MFVEFKNVDDANLALGAIHNHPFDAKHTFKANRFTDVERYMEMDETYVEPKLEIFEARVRPQRPTNLIMFSIPL